MPSTPLASEQARSLFEKENLRFPPLPAPLAERLRALNAHLFATMDLPRAAYGLDFFVDQAVRGQVPEAYAVVGFDGHGLNSWAAHYYLVEGALALFTQLHWGGAYTDANSARQLIDSVYQRCESIQEKTARALRQDRIPAGWRLVVVVSSFSTPGWVWVPATASAKSDWQRSQRMLTVLEDHLQDVLNGAVSLA